MDKASLELWICGSILKTFVVKTGSTSGLTAVRQKDEIQVKFKTPIKAFQISLTELQYYYNVTNPF